MLLNVAKHRTVRFRLHYSPQWRIIIKNNIQCDIYNVQLYSDLPALNFIVDFKSFKLLYDHITAVCICITLRHNHYGLSLFFFWWKYSRVCSEPVITPGVPHQALLGSDSLFYTVKQHQQQQQSLQGIEQKTGSRLPLRGQHVNRWRSCCLHRFPFILRLDFFPLLLSPC